MPNGNQEHERLRLLRNQQLADRDPNVKQRKFQRMSARREQRPKKAYSLRRMWGDISHAWKGFFYGAVLGTLIMVVLPLIWVSRWATLCSTISIIILPLIGVLFGRAFDTRDEIKKLAR